MQKHLDLVNILFAFPAFFIDGVESAHHPFTAPYPEDEHLVYSSPEQVIQISNFTFMLEILKKKSVHYGSNIFCAIL